MSDKTTALAHREKSTALSMFDVESYDQLRSRVEDISRSGLIPQSYRNKPEDILVAVEMGRDVGLKPLQSLQSISVINGAPVVWGPGLLAIIQNSSVCEYVMLTYDLQNKIAYCTCKRTTDPKEQVFPFSWEDAREAGLISRETYKKYPQNMLRWRALALASKFAFPDVSKGLVVAEEAMDYPPERGGGDVRARDLTEGIRNKTTAQTVANVKEQAHEDTATDAMYEVVDESTGEVIETQASLFNEKSGAAPSVLDMSMDALGLTDDEGMDLLCQLILDNAAARASSISAADINRVIKAVSVIMAHTKNGKALINFCSYTGRTLHSPTAIKDAWTASQK
tara:strand:+ start:13577 stop:14593 length:1017 start_codon:yes stop_codon:yes gene_type:complete